MNRLQNVKTILWTITGLAAAVGVTRFLFGLGATTNLSDATPWGVWIGFDVMAGVALAGGGFVMTAIFYVFKREKYHDLVKPAVLTAFLGYLAVIFGLMFDLGLPWNIWHMMIYWNLHSPLFEVGWCVMLYTTVLLLEFSPVPLEETSRYAKIRQILMKFRFPLVLLGIMLSTLHQSSLGSLALLWPNKLHELWYSSIIPVQFFVSAVALGLMMVSLESLVSHWLYRRKAEHDLVAGLAKGAVWVLSVYLIIKLADIVAAGEFAMIFNGSWESNLFIFELLISAIIPLVLFLIPRVRTSPGGQWTGASLVVFGMIFNRINVGGLTMLRATGDAYIPSWMEITISLGVVSIAALVFFFAVEKLHIWDSRPTHPEKLPHTPPEFDYSSRVWLGTPLVAGRTKYSLAFVLSFAMGFAFMPQDKIEGKGVEVIRVQEARGGDTLFIDGNRDSFGTLFDHARHIDSLGQQESCAKCHHMNMPGDRESGCGECHRSMYVEVDVFHHNWHADPNGANIACDLCHEPGLERQKSTAKRCNECHIDLFANPAADTLDSYLAVSYVDAMHDLCVECHQKRAVQDTTKQVQAQCASCHANPPPNYLQDNMRNVLGQPAYNQVMLPEAGAAATSRQEQQDEH